MMINYSKGEIYTIICRYDPKLVYVGQSTQSLAERWGEHKRDYRQGNHLLFYKQIQDVNDGNIDLCEEYPCKNGMDLHRRLGEGQAMREIGTLNVKFPIDYYSKHGYVYTSQFLISLEFTPAPMTNHSIVYFSDVKVW